MHLIPAFAGMTVVMDYLGNKSLRRVEFPSGALK